MEIYVVREDFLEVADFEERADFLTTGRRKEKRNPWEELGEHGYR